MQQNLKGTPTSEKLGRLPFPNRSPVSEIFQAHDSKKNESSSLADAISKKKRDTHCSVFARTLATPSHAEFILIAIHEESLSFA